MLRLETRNPCPLVPAESSKTPSLGRAEAASSSAALLDPSNGAPAGGDKAEAVLKRLRENWPLEFRDGARCDSSRGRAACVIPVVIRLALITGN
jgi:hypothetical protein